MIELKAKRGRKRKTDSTRAIAYVRISPREEQTGLGVEAQRHAIEAYAKAHGLTIAVWCEDIDVSGGDMIDQRPQLVEALKAMKVERAAVLLVAKRCRLARDQMIAAMLHRLVERDSGRIECADGVGNGNDPTAVMMRGMADLFAQYERAMIITRTKAALAAKKRRGERVGQEPYGWTTEQADDGTPIQGGRLVRVESEQTVICRLHECRADGQTVTGMVADLNAQDVPARGSRWHATTVRRILDREV